ELTIAEAVPPSLKPGHQRGSTCAKALFPALNFAVDRASKAVMLPGPLGGVLTVAGEQFQPFLLRVEVQPALVALLLKMKEAPDGGAARDRLAFEGDRAARFAPEWHLVLQEAKPPKGMQVAQPARAVLDVGLEVMDRVLKAVPPRVDQVE